MTTLASLLDSTSILLDVDTESWQDAVHTAGSLLERSGAADAAYTTSMIANVTDNGPYIVVAPGFAFAHARPSAAVHRTALSWVRLGTPVSFGHPTNDPVDLVVALAATDASTHTSAMAQLAKVIGRPKTRAALNAASSPAEILEILNNPRSTPPSTASDTASNTASNTAPSSTYPGRSTRDHILTVCGNGLGTSLFLKNTLEEVLNRWGWGSLVSVEATDTISAKGKAHEADVIFTSGEIAKTLGDPGVPIWVMQDFTSTDAADAALRQIYDL